MISHHELIEEFEILHSANLRLHAYWKQFRKLYTVSDDRMVLLSNIASGLFRLVQDSLRDNVFILIARMTDPPQTGGYDNMSLNRLIDSLKGHIDSGTLSNLRTDLEALLTKCVGIRAWRRKWFAHIDRTFALQNNPTLLPSVSRGSIDEIIVDIDTLLNHVAMCLKRPDFDYDSLQILGDADDLIEALEQ